jgi:hypothetical protein
MKKTILLNIFLLCGLSVFAQKGFHAGLSGGYNLTFIINQNNYGGPEYEYAPTYGYMYGLSAGYNFDKHFGLQAEGEMSKQGQHYSHEDMDHNILTRNVDLTYMHVPLMFKYSGGGNYPTRFYIMAGPQFSYLQSAHISVKSNEQNTSQSVPDRFVHNSVEAVLDLGSDFTIYKNLYGSAGLRFNYGFNDINAPAWRIPNLTGLYDGSQNALSGVHFGLSYMLCHMDKVEKY